MPKKPLVNQNRQEQQTVAESSVTVTPKAVLNHPVTTPEPQAESRGPNAFKVATTQPAIIPQPQPLPAVADGRRRVIIEKVTPEIDGGRFPINTNGSGSCLGHD